EMSPFEARIAEVWAKQLGLPKIGPEQDFFTDLGGHSLVAAKLVTALRTELNLTIAVRDLYAHPTVRRLVAHSGESTAQKVVAPDHAVHAAKTPAPRRPWSTVLLQAIYLLSVVPLLALPLVYILPLTIDVLQRRASVLDLAIAGFGIVLATWLALLAV